MNLSTCRVPAGVLMLNLALGLAGCAQFTTSDTERAGLQSAADAAGKAYVDCLTSQAGNYVGSSDDVQSITTIARKNCTGARDVAARAQGELQSTSYILAGSEVEGRMKALDDRGETAIAELVLNRTAAAPAVAATAAAPAPAAANRTGYLACMQAQGERWATVQEPATVIADTAHGRCAGQLAGSATATETEQEGRTLVMGLVLDRKARAPGAGQ